MESLYKTYIELKSTINSPKLYLINYFDGIRNKIDIEYQIYIIKNDLGVAAQEKALQQQIELLDEVTLLQKQCINNLAATNPFGQSNKLVDIERCLKGLNWRDKVAISKLEKQLYRQLFARKKELFMNKGIVFFGIDDCDKFYKINLAWNKKTEVYEERNNQEIMFGILIIITDDFLLYSDKFKQWIDSPNKFGHDYCNEYLRIDQLQDIIRDRIENNSIRAVNQIEINLKKQTELKLYWANNMFVREWSADLPALKKVNLTKGFLTGLDPATFKNMINLEELNLSWNRIQALDSSLFSCNKNLRRLDLSFNETSVLGCDIFKGLDNLTELDLSGNKLTNLPEKLFQDLASLKVLNLSSNQIVGLQPGLFSNLAKLEVLDLSYNRIRILPEGILQDLNSLKQVNISNFTIKKVIVLDNNISPDLFIVGDVHVPENEKSSKPVQNSVFRKIRDVFKSIF